MTAPAAINPRALRVLPMLGSPVDAEALSACRRVGAILAKDGQNYNDLATAIRVAGEATASGPTWDSAAWDAAGAYVRPYRRKKYTFTPAQASEHRRQALWVRNAEAGRLSQRERQFITDICHQRRELTVAQADWLAVIHERIAMENRHA